MICFMIRKAEIENQKLYYYKIQQWVTCVHQFFQKEIIWHFPVVLEEIAFLMGSPPPSLHPAGCHTGHQFSNLKGANKELLAARFWHNTRIYYWQSYLVDSFLVLNFSSPENSTSDSIQKDFFFIWSLRKQLR